jgi:hypothetical protein
MQAGISKGKSPKTYEFSYGGVRKMKKKALLVGAVVVALALAGCATNAGRFDSTTPPEEDCTLLIGKSYATLVTRFDNQTVSWLGQKVYGFLDGSFVIQVPAGEHMITGGEPDPASGNLRYETSTKFTFVAGKTYDVSVVSRNFKILETAVSQ